MPNVLSGEPPVHVVGMMLVDLRTAAIGLPSRVASDLAGLAVLRRSVARALGARNLDHVALLSAPEQHEEIRALLGPLAGDPRVILSPLPAGRDAIYGKLDPDYVRRARRWSLSGWRGGISGACWFDELLAPAAMTRLAGQLHADAVALLAPEAALADSALIDAIVEQYRQHHDRFRMTFSQAPPGLGTICLSADMLAELAAAGQTIGRSLAYDPDDRRADFVSSEATVKLPIEAVACPHRFLADTARGFALLDRLIRHELPSAECQVSSDTGHSALDSARAALAIFDAEPEPWPNEIDFELTTERPVADVLRPCRPVVPVRGPVGQGDDRLLDRLCESIQASGADDIVVTVGGFGDPLLHPRVLEVAARLKSAGALAVAVRTSGLGLTDEMVSRLMDSDEGRQVDLLAVELDAATGEGYQRLKGVDGFAAVIAGMQRLRGERARHGRPGPLLVVEMVKCPATLPEMEEFFDRWRFADEAHLAGLHDYAGQFHSPAGPGWTTAPPRRRPCRRIDRRLTVLADGAVPICDLDLKATCPVGRLQDQSLDEIWFAEPLAQARSAHRHGRLDSLPLCQRCDQWNRP